MQGRGGHGQVHPPPRHCQNSGDLLPAGDRAAWGIEAGQPIFINGDGPQRRDLTHVADVARAVELALRWLGPGAAVLNVGTGRNHSVMDMLAAATKTATSLVEHQAPHPVDVPETLASITAAAAQLGVATPDLLPDGPDS